MTSEKKRIPTQSSISIIVRGKLSSFSTGATYRQILEVYKTAVLWEWESKQRISDADATLSPSRMYRLIMDDPPAREEINDDELGIVFSDWCPLGNLTMDDKETRVDTDSSPLNSLLGKVELRGLVEIGLTIPKHGRVVAVCVWSGNIRKVCHIAHCPGLNVSCSLCLKFRELGCSSIGPHSQKPQ